MINTFFKIAWRNLIRNKTYSLINMIGLATGLACFLLISMFVADELSYDRHFRDAERIYRINSSIRLGGAESNLTVSSDPMGAALKKDYPQVEQFTRIYNSNGSKLIKKDDQYVNEKQVAHVDSTFFEVFNFNAVAGDLSTALDNPNTVVITRSTAEKYFATKDAVGKIIESNENGSTLYRVSAVIEDMPRNTHFNFAFLFSMDNLEYPFGSYLSHNFQTYIKLKPGFNYHDFEKNFTSYTSKYVIPQAQQVMDVKSMEDFEKSGNRLHYSLIPVVNIHLYSNLFPELAVNGNIQYVYIFSAVAVFILLLACINYINLSTARSMKRAREVGVRKVLGTTRKNLTRQFISESSLTVFISMLIAILIVTIVLPEFNNLASKELEISSLFKSKMLLVVISLPILVSFLAGSYPAFFLSSFKPTEVLKGKLTSNSSKSLIRSSLVVFQFATSIILIVATITVFRQLDFIQNRKIGFNKEQVLLIEGTGNLGNNRLAFMNELKKLPGVISGTYAGYLPVSGSARNDHTYSRESVLSSTNTYNMQTWRIDEHYIPTMGMEIIEGRNFSPSFGTDSTGIIINEATAKLLGMTDPLGKKIYTLDDFQNKKLVTYTIIGVVKNFNFESMRQNITPLCFVFGEASWVTAFRVKPENIPDIIRSSEQKWKEMSTGFPFSYTFLDESFSRMYEAEQRVGKVAIVFSALAVLIACLGLFGLSTYMAEQRTKEIGVRKVLGASVNNIMMMLSRDFLKLVVIAAIIAFPVAWWSMSSWLQDFAFRINLGWWIFAIAGLLALIVALFTVSFQAFRAALTNPVKSLRTE